MKTIDFPWDLSVRITEKSDSVSCGREHRRRLVENQDLGVTVERLEDLCALLHPDREVLDDRLGIDVEAVSPRGLAQLLVRAGVIEHGPRADRLEAEHDVLGDGEDGHEHEVLMDHADAVLDGMLRLEDRDHLVIDEDLTLGHGDHAEQHVHERRLAGAVLPEEAVDLARLDREVDVVVGGERAEALRDPRATRVFIGGTP